MTNTYVQKKLIFYNLLTGHSGPSDSAEPRFRPALPLEFVCSSALEPRDPHRTARTDART